MYTVYSLYYSDKPFQVAKDKGFIGSRKGSIGRVLQDHLRKRQKGAHSNKHIQATGKRQLSLYVIASGLSLEDCTALLRDLRPENNLGWNLTKASRSTQERHTGKTRPQKTKLRISEGMVGKNAGKTYSEAHRKAISAGSQNKFRKADIYEYASEDKIASGVSIPYWCAMFGYTKSGLYKTLNADFSKPHHTTRNCYFYRGLYARWSDAS